VILKQIPKIDGLVRQASALNQIEAQRTDYDAVLTQLKQREDTIRVLRGSIAKTSNPAAGALTARDGSVQVALQTQEIEGLLKKALELNQKAETAGGAPK